MGRAFQAAMTLLQALSTAANVDEEPAVRVTTTSGAVHWGLVYKVLRASTDAGSGTLHLATSAPGVVLIAEHRIESIKLLPDGIPDEVGGA